MSDQQKLKCSERRCSWVGTLAQALQAPHPFRDGDEVRGCPDCLEVETLVYACDEPGCTEEVSCGTPTPGGGYRTTCGKHAPRP